MANIEARIRMAAESILENEALRDGLQDKEAASALLNWGVSWAQSLAKQTADTEDDEEADQAIYPRMKALRKMMSAVKELAAADGWSSEALMQSMETVLSQARILNGESWQPPVNIEQQIRLISQTGDSRARLKALLDLVTGATLPGEGTSASETVAPAHNPPQQPGGFFQKLFRRIKGD